MKEMCKGPSQYLLHSQHSVKQTVIYLSLLFRFIVFLTEGCGVQ